MPPAKSTPTGRTLPLGWSGTAASAEDRLGGAPVEAGGTGPESGRSRRRPRLLLAAAIAMVLALVLVLPRLLVGGPGPEELVREHLDALVTADIATVREHLDTGQEASDAAMTAAILRAAEERVTGYAIDAVEQHGEQAEVTATLRTASTSQKATFTAHSESAGPFSRTRWMLDPVPSAVVTVTVPGRADVLRINGVEMPLDELPTRATSHDQQVVSLRLLPGTYALEVNGAGELLDPAVETLVVPAPGSTLHHAGTVVGYDLDDEGRSQVRARILEVLEDCTEATVAIPVSCPFSALDLSPGTEGTWEVTPPAEFRFDRHIGETWNIASSRGRADFTPAPTSDGQTPPPRQITFFLAATAEIDPSGQLQTSVRPGTISVMVGCESGGNGEGADPSDESSAPSCTDDA